MDLKEGTLKKRLDQILVDKGIYPSRTSAQGDILAGNIFVNGERMDKPGTMVKSDTEIRVAEKSKKYVSRGGTKLEKALAAFEIGLEDKVVIDVGASTGGFTDCVLKNKARKVYSVDVGYGQLAWELRNDPRVIVMERTNARNLKPEDLDEMVDFASVDVSFISLDKILKPVYDVLSEFGSCVCLIKPQFEAGREKVGKKGVVKSFDVHVEVIEKIIAFARSLGFLDSGLTYSPIKGPEGNVEFLLHLKKSDSRDFKLSEEAIVNVVKKAHEAL